MPTENASKDRPCRRRRTVLKASLLGGALIATAPLPLQAALARSERRLALQNLHTGERVDLPYWVEGEYLPDSMADISRVLRDHRSGESYPIDPALLDLICALQASVGSRHSYQVISGYRSPATNARLRSDGRGVAKRSLHMQGKAIDIRLPGTDLTQLHAAARKLQAGGVGLYSRSNFIHVDTGRVRYW